MKTPETEVRRGLARLRRALEKAKREIRGLRARLDESEADGYPGGDYDQMESLVTTAAELAGQEQARQRAKVLRAGGIGRVPLRSIDGGGVRRPERRGDGGPPAPGGRP